MTTEVRDQEIETKKLAIVSGANGALGKAYLEYFKSHNYRCLGLVRTPPENSIEGIDYLACDLTDREKVKSSLEKITSEAAEIIFVHGIGKFKFEENGTPAIDENKDGIDDEVWSSNYATLVNITDSLIERIGNNDLTVIGFGSVTDKFEIPFFRSYRIAKNSARKFLQEVAQQNKVYSRFVGVSTTDTGNEEKLRPNADRTYWLKPIEIVNNSIKTILDKTNRYVELDIFKPKPGFDPSYYENPEAILEKWKREMKGGAN